MAKPPKRPWISPLTARSDGLVGNGGDLRPDTLRAAYRDGVFPWFNDGDPILWWSPDPRAIFELDGLHVSRSLARTLKSGRFTTTVNACFDRVMRGCGEGREEGTWVTPTMLAAYTELHRQGDAHSVEVWLEAELVGGIYGVSVGAAFCGESMFHTATDASKVALVTLVERLKQRGYELFDTQMVTPHTGRMGAIEIPRADYLTRLAAVAGRTGVSFV